jgi:hypothetical protein
VFVGFDNRRDFDDLLRKELKCTDCLHITCNGCDFLYSISWAMVRKREVMK